MAVLTIDDAPSPLFADKLRWLKERNVPAVFFVWGEKAAEAQERLIEATAAGFPLANHSWTHPRFSALDEAAAREEIAKTEELLERIHRAAGVPRDRRYFRFPYFDRGEGEREAAFQAILAEFGFVPADLPGAGRSRAVGDASGDGARTGPLGGRLDTLCGFDQKEYWLGDAAAPDGLSDAETILARIGAGSPAGDATILIHDHGYSHDLFFRCVERYLGLGVEFALP